MEYDVIVRGGLVIDGTGAAPFKSDVGIRDGVIAAVGESVSGTAKSEIDATGLVVSPGFIDAHTHYDAQIDWDPWLGSSGRHGVTTILMGNCGFTLAPVKPSDRDYVVQMLTRVEGMPLEALKDGVTWKWESYGEYLDAIDASLGVNVMPQVGHSAIRYYAMGLDACEREATPDEVAAMEGLVKDAMASGAWGFTTSTSAMHNDSAGRPIPSRMAAPDEFVRLAAAMKDKPGALIGISPGTKFSGISPAERDLMIDMARAGDATVLWNPLKYSDQEPGLLDKMLTASAEAEERGARIYAVFNPGPDGPMRLDMQNAFRFDILPKWKSINVLPLKEKLAAYADPVTRALLKKDLAEGEGLLASGLRTMWPRILVAEAFHPENKTYVGSKIQDIAEREGVEPIDIFLDIAVRDELQTVFMQEERTETSSATAAMDRASASKYVVYGGSDAGAHLDFMSNEGMPSRAIALRVREEGRYSLEGIVHGFTGRVADVLGLQGRGRLQVGAAADVTVFDMASIGVSDPYMAADLPGGSARLSTDAVGIQYTLVNGVMAYEKGKVTTTPAGKLLRRH